MSDLTKALQLVQEQGSSVDIRYGTVSSVSGNTAYVELTPDVEVPARLACSCSEDDRVILVQNNDKFDVIGNLTNFGGGGGGSSYFAKCMTRKTVAAKEVTIEGFPETITEGMQVVICLYFGNSADMPTLSINGGEAMYLASDGSTVIGNLNALTVLSLYCIEVEGEKFWIRS